MVFAFIPPKDYFNPPMCLWCSLTAVGGHIAERGMDRILQTKLTKHSQQVVIFMAFSNNISCVNHSEKMHILSILYHLYLLKCVNSIVNY